MKSIILTLFIFLSLVDTNLSFASNPRTAKYHIFALLGSVHGVAEDIEKARDLYRLYESSKKMGNEANFSVFVANGLEAQRFIAVLTKRVLDKKALLIKETLPAGLTPVEKNRLAILKKESITQENIDELARKIKPCDVESLRKRLDSAKVDVKEGDHVIVNVIAHGFHAGDQDATETGGFGWDREAPDKPMNRISWKDFNSMISPFSKEKTAVITTACYGGGVHALARETQNLCTFSVVPFSEAGKAIAKFHEESYLSSFWANLESLNALGAASLAAAMSDHQNSATSSYFDFVDFTLSVGPYNRNHLKYSLLKIEDPILKAQDAKNQGAQGSVQYIFDSERAYAYSCDLYGNVFTPTMKQIKDFKQISDFILVKNESDLLPERVEAILKADEQFLVHFEQMDKHKLPKGMPPELLDYFRPEFKSKMNLVADLRRVSQSNPLELTKGLALYDQKLKELRSAGNNKELESFIQAYQREMTRLVSGLLDTSPGYNHLHLMIERFERLREFYGKASPEQIDHANSLLRCELEPFRKQNPF